MKKLISNSLRLLPAALGLVFALNTAQATTWYWDGSTQNSNGQSDNTTTTGLTWLGTGAGAGFWDNATSQQLASWTAGDSAVFGGSAASETVTASALTIGSLTFGSGGLGTGTGTTPAYTVSSSTITLSSGSAITANTPTTISSVLAGSGLSLTVGGPATLTLSGVNTYSGGTTISSGSALTIGGSGKLAAAGNIGNGGTFTYNSSAALTLSGVISGAGAVVQSGSGTLTLTKANTYTGGTTINSGRTLTLGAPPSVGGTLYGAGAIINNGTLNYNNPASYTISGPISGSGSLSVNPNGTLGSQLTLSGANTYSGRTTISAAGQVIISSDGNLGTPPSTFTANQLVMNYGFLKANGTFTLNANRGITMGAGSSGIGASIQVNPGFTLTLAAPITGPFGFISGSGEVNFGYGTNLLTANSTYTGPTAISTGRLMLGVNGALPYGTTLLISSDLSTIGNAGAIFDLGGFSQTIGPLSSTNTLYPLAGYGNATPTIVLNGALTILQTNTATVFGGQIIGSGSLTLNGNSSGMLTLSNYPNTYTGGTTINGGTLDVGTSGSSITGDVTVNSGTLQLDTSAALSSTATLTLAPAAAVNLNYSGTQTIAALNFGASPQATGLWGAVTNAGATFTDSRFTGAGLLLVCPAPQTITPAASSMCAGATNTASVPVTSGATYLWSVNNGTIISGGTSSTVTYSAWAVSPVTLNCVVTSPCGYQSAGGQNVEVAVNICGSVLHTTNVVYDAVNGVTLTGIGVLAAPWYLNASTDVSASLPWPTIQVGLVSSSPFTISDPDAINHSQRFYYLTNSP